MQSELQKITIKEKIGYGLGDTASNLFFQITIYYIMFFYTDVFGLDPKDVGLMFLLTRIWDAINDPIMGAIADKTKTKWGTYRPYLLWIAIPFGVVFLLAFWTPELWSHMLGIKFSYGAKLVYAYITYTLMMMIYTAINVPYAALMGVISPNADERTVISSFRFVLVFIAQFTIQFALIVMVKYFGDDTKTSVVGWQRAIMVLASVATILFIITFFSTRERTSVSVVDKHSFLTNIGDIAGNFPWLLIAGATIFQLTHICMRGGDITYYFSNFVKDQPVGSWGIVTGEVLERYFMVIGAGFTIAGAVMTNWFTNLLGKSKTYSGFMLLVAISCCLVFFLRPEQVVALFILNFITSFAMGPVSVLQWAIYTDTAAYQEWKCSRRSTAFIMAASLFALKLGVAFGGAALAWVLSYYGYFKPTEEQLAQMVQGVNVVIEQPESAVTGIRLAMSVYPAIAAILAMIFMLFYPLDKARMEEIEADLIERGKQDNNNQF